MAHTIFICPDSLLHHPELSLPQLLVRADTLGLDKVLRRNLTRIGFKNGILFINNWHVFVTIIFSIPFKETFDNILSYRYWRNIISSVKEKPNYSWCKFCLKYQFAFPFSQFSFPIAGFKYQRLFTNYLLDSVAQEDHSWRTGMRIRIRWFFAFRIRILSVTTDI